MLEKVRRRWLWITDPVAERVAIGLTDGPVNELLLLGVGAYAALRSIRDGVSLAPGSFSTEVRDLIWFSLLCGLCAYASIELLKRLLDIRRAFQYRTTVRWLRNNRMALKQLLQAMSVRGDEKSEEVRRIFRLPSEQLTAQVAAAADRALALTAPDSVQPYPEFLSALVGIDPQESIRPGTEEEFEVANELRARIDQLQVALGERWRRNVQLAAVWIAGAYGVAFTFAADVSDRADARYLLAAFLLGGVVAWLARDVAAVVERLRQP